MEWLYELVVYGAVFFGGGAFVLALGWWLFCRAIESGMGYRGGRAQ